ncbi:hypothetical protein AZE42_11905 [Rhizopogon vesiculosus]|uniref:Uncharacterized protein n=1 Tax=Rhizopogon vesiculosus TaxID=180088 RepID=A0A1J8PM83_9AGAM|nr:hypothetical protein AZE42_11905 [Rhizopogon vesiculosus]
MVDHSPILLTPMADPPFQIQNHWVTTEDLYDVCEYATSRLLACRRAVVISYATNTFGFKDAFKGWLSWKLETFIGPIINICISSSVLPLTSAYLNKILTIQAITRLESMPQSSSLFDRFIEIDPDRYVPQWCNDMRSAVKFSFDWWSSCHIDHERPFT